MCDGVQRKWDSLFNLPRERRWRIEASKTQGCVSLYGKARIGVTYCSIVLFEDEAFNVPGECCIVDRLISYRSHSLPRRKRDWFPQSASS